MYKKILISEDKMKFRPLQDRILVKEFEIVGGHSDAAYFFKKSFRGQLWSHTVQF